MAVVAGRSTRSLDSVISMPDELFMAVFLGGLIVACGYLLLMQLFRLLGRDPSASRPQTTRVGLLLYLGLGLVPVVGLATPVVAPSSWLGAWLAEHGMPAFVAICAVWFLVAGAILRKFGYRDMTMGKK